MSTRQLDEELAAAIFAAAAQIDERRPLAWKNTNLGLHVNFTVRGDRYSILIADGKRALINGVESWGGTEFLHTNATMIQHRAVKAAAMRSIAAYAAGAR